MTLPLPRRALRLARPLRAAFVAAAVVVLCLAGGAAPVGASTDSDHDGLSNAFEQAYGLNPHAKDSNHDGLRDAAEDPDGDGLSNLGEQRFDTNPLKADTDGDGTPDNQEDANGNGITNGAEQDRRAVPSNLTPSLSQAAKDQPQSYRDGCHSGPYEAAIRPCAYGATRGSITVAIFGDSHMAQWLPALVKAGSARGWKIVSITKSACPSVTVQFQEPVFHGAEASCNTWRSRGESWLRVHKPDLVIVANSHKYRLIDSQGKRIPRSGLEQAWADGLGTTLDALPAASRLLVLGDTPFMSANVPACLSKHRTNISACEKPRSKALDPAHDAAEASVAESHGATFAGLNDKVCSYDPCPAVVNELLVYRNESHLTATYARQLSPSLARIVNGALP